VSRPYQKLLHFNDPGIAGTAAGDLSMAVFETMRDRFPETRSNVTIRQINDLLDELVAIKNPFKTTHDWRSSSRAGGLLPPQKKKNNPVLRRKWAEKLIRMGLSPLEHKWLVRILLQKIEVGMGSKTILQNWRKHALNLYQGNNNLKAVCTFLCNPSFVRNLQEEDEER
jgi:DNA ligase N terminus